MKQLGFMRRVKHSGCFQLYHDRPLDEQVDSKVCNQPIAEPNRSWDLPVNLQTTIRQRHTHCCFVYGFQKSISKLVVNVKEYTNNFAGSPSMFQFADCCVHKTWS